MPREQLNALAKEIGKVRRQVKASRHTFIDDPGLREAFKGLYRLWDDSVSVAVEHGEEKQQLADALWALWEKSEQIRTRKSACETALEEAETHAKTLLRLHRSAGRRLSPPPRFDQVISDEKLRANVRTRWNEVEICVEQGAHIAAIVMIGSIVEAVLLARCRSDPRSANSARSTPKAPSKAGKLKPKPIETWKFAELIDVAEECGWLSRVEKDASHILRDWRNLVHPNKQVENDIAVGERESELLLVLCRQLLK